MEDKRNCLFDQLCCRTLSSDRVVVDNRWKHLHRSMAIQKEYVSAAITCNRK